MTQPAEFDLTRPGAEPPVVLTSQTGTEKNRGRLAFNVPTVVAAAYLILVVLTSLLAPIIWPEVATQQAGDIMNANKGPSGEHLLGTDTLGRDVLLRILVGTRPTVVGVLVGLAVVTVVGVPVGVAAGYFQGRFDKIMSWLADIVFSVPAIVVIIAVLAVFRGSMLAAMVTFGVLTAPGLMRVVRAATLQVREELYVSAAQVAGLSAPYILTRHVVPRLRGVLAVQLSLIGGFAILVQTGLAFLGLLLAPPAPSWGGAVAEGASVLALNSWLIWPPGVVIALTVLAFGLISDNIRTRAGGASILKPSAVLRLAKRAQREMIVHPGGEEPFAGAMSAGASPDLVRIRDLRVCAVGPSGETRIVDAASISIGYGETVALVGESGCGKSVTAAALMGAVPANLVVTGGSIEFEGHDLTRLDRRALRAFHGRQIGFVGQEPMIGLNPALRVGAQLAELVRLHHGCSSKEAKRRALGLLESVRLPDPVKVSRKFPHELSGGMAQRVAIARALAGEPKLLIADEPTTALDVTVQAEILALLRETQEKREMAILLITHDWGVVAEVCDRAVVMYAGQVIESGSVVNLLGQPRHPYTGLLLASDPHRSRGLDVLPTIPGVVPPPGTWPSGCRFAGRCPHVREECRAHDIEMRQVDNGSVVRCVRPLVGGQE